jgi:hypothetical protein
MFAFEASEVMINLSKAYKKYLIGDDIL